MYLCESDFNISSQVKLNHFEHTYPQSFLEQDSSLILVQSTGGVCASIQIPFLTNLRDSNYIAVNGATLKIPIHNTDDNMPFPNYLSLYKQPEEMESLSGLLISNGALNEFGTHYEFNIQDYVQAVISEDMPPMFKLYTKEPNSNAERVVLTNTPQNPISLELLLIKDNN